MGAAASTASPSLSSYVDREIARVKKEDDDDRDWLFVDEVLDISTPLELPIDFKHFATLYALDAEKDGIFRGKDILAFTHLWAQRRRVRLRHEFEADVRGTCDVELVLAARRDGVASVVQWFMRVLEARYPPLTPSKLPSVRLFHADAVQILHQVFCAELVGALPYRETVVLLQQASEAQGLLDLSDATLDDYVAVSVLESFLAELLASFVSFLPSVSLRYAVPSLTHPSSTPSATPTGAAAAASASAAAAVAAAATTTTTTTTTTTSLPLSPPIAAVAAPGPQFQFHASLSASVASAQPPPAASSSPAFPELNAAVAAAAADAVLASSTPTPTR